MKKTYLPAKRRRPSKIQTVTIPTEIELINLEKQLNPKEKYFKKRLDSLERNVDRLRKINTRTAVNTVGNINNITVYQIGSTLTEIARQVSYERVLRIFNETEVSTDILLLTFGTLLAGSANLTINDNIFPVPAGESVQFYVEETDAVGAAFDKNKEGTERVRVIEFTLPMFLLQDLGSR